MASIGGSKIEVQPIVLRSMARIVLVESASVWQRTRSTIPSNSKINDETY